MQAVRNVPALAVNSLPRVQCASLEDVKLTLGDTDYCNVLQSTVRLTPEIITDKARGGGVCVCVNVCACVCVCVPLLLSVTEAKERRKG